MTRSNESKLTGYAHVMRLLRSLESDLGLSDFSPLERSIIAALSLEEYGVGARTESIQNNKILDYPTQASFYRALKKLRQKNVVETVGDRKTGIYRLVQAT
jgi:hypothetical protein